jgi:hypothetical protein
MICVSEILPYGALSEEEKSAPQPPINFVIGWGIANVSQSVNASADVFDPVAV